MTETAKIPSRGWIIVRDTLLVGVVYAVLLIAIYALLHFSLSLVDVLGMAIVGTLGFGAAVLLPIALFRNRRPGDYGTAFFGSLFALAGGVIGGILVLFLLWQVQLPRGNWMALPTPPEKAVEILDGDTYLVFGKGVFVRSETGTIYSFECGNNLPCDWVVLEETPTDETQNPDFCAPDGEAQYHPPFTPLTGGGVRDSYVDVFCGADYGIQTNYLLMQDGSLWTWDHFSGMSVIIEWGIIVGLGLVLGFCLIPVFGARPAET